MGDDAGPGARICAVADLPIGVVTEVKLGGRRRAVAVRRLDDSVVLFTSTCPHRAAPLAKGRVRARVTSDCPGTIDVDPSRPVLVCPWHNWEFDLDTGAALADASTTLKIYPTVVADGVVHLVAGRSA